MLHFFSFVLIISLGYPISGTLNSLPTSILEDVTCNKSSIHFAPESLQQLEFIFQVANAYNFTIRQLTSREKLVNSNKTGIWNDTNASEILVNTSNFNHFEYDKITSYARVGAGLLLVEVTKKLHNLGRALLCIPPKPEDTVGAAVLTGTHSSSLTLPTKFSHQVVGLVYLDKSGKLRNLTVSENSSFYEEHLLHKDFFGVIIEVTIFTISQYKIATRNYYKSDRLVWENTKEFLNIVKTYDFFEFTWFPISKEMLVSTSEIVGMDMPGNCKKHSNLDFTVEEFHYISEMLKAMQTTVLDVGMLFAQLDELKSMYQIDHTGSKVLCSPAVGYGNKMMMSQRENKVNKLFDSQEFRVTIPLSELENTLMTVKEGLEAHPEEIYHTGIKFEFFGDFDKSLNLEEAFVEISWLSFDLKMKAENSLEGSLKTKDKEDIFSELIRKLGGHQLQINC